MAKTITVDDDGVVGDVQDDGQGRGQTVEEMAQNNGVDRDGFARVDVFEVAGEHEQLNFELDHRRVDPDGRPMVSTLKAKLPQMYVSGQFQPGQRVRIEVEILVEDLQFPPIKEQGVRMGTERRHVGEVVRARMAKTKRSK